MFCVKCGYQIKDGYRFCPKCGTPAFVEKEESQSENGAQVEEAKVNAEKEESNDGQQGQRNNFLFSLLVLSSYIIKADGKAMHSEMELVRQMLRQNFGNDAVGQGNEILNKLFDEQKREGLQQYKQTVRQCCGQINQQMDYSQRLQLLNYLVMVAQADGSVPQSEISALKECAIWMGLRETEVDSMLHLSGDSLEDHQRKASSSNNNVFVPNPLIAEELDIVGVKKKAELGDREAMLRQAFRYEMGIGVEKDIKKAEELYDKVGGKECIIISSASTYVFKVELMYNLCKTSE